MVKKKLNILFIADPESHDREWISHFGGEYNLFVLRRNAHALWPVQPGTKVVNTGCIDDFSILKPLAIWKTTRKIKKIINKNDIDVIHIFYAEPNVLWAIFKRCFKIPIILTTRGTDVLVTLTQFFEQKSPRNLHVRLLYKKAFHACDLITCTSHSQKQRVHKLFGTRQTQVIRTGFLIPENTTYSREKLPSALHGNPFVLMPRAMRPLYKHEFTLDAIELLSAHIKSKYTFVFLNRDSKDVDYVKQIEERMKKLSGVHIIFLTQRSRNELYTLLYFAELVVMNPVSDGTPVTGLEAMYFECPLILGCARYDEDIFGNWTYKISSWKEEELSTLIEKVLLNPDHHMISTAKKVVVERANRNIEMSRLDRLYHSLVN